MAFRVYLLACAVVMVVFSRGDATAIVMDCPATFSNGEENTVACVVDTAAIANAGCTVNPTNVLFRFTPAGGSVTTKCTTDYAPNDCNTSPAAGQCGCTEQSGSTRKYTYRFLGNKDNDSGAKLVCSVCAANPPVSVVEGSCASLSFASSTSTTSMPVTTTASPSTTTPVTATASSSTTAPVTATASPSTTTPVTATDAPTRLPPSVRLQPNTQVENSQMSLGNRSGGANGCARADVFGIILAFAAFLVMVGHAL